jgi:hypothetical protein
MRRLAAATVAVLLVAGSAAAEPLATGASRLPDEGSATEYWDLVARLDGGRRLVARFLVTNQGPGERTAVAVGHLIQPDGSAVRFHNGRLQGRWSMDEDGLALEIGSSSLDLRLPVRRFVVDKTRKGIKIELRFRSTEAAPRPQIDGDPEHRVELLDLAVPVEGRVWVRGMEAPVAVAGRGAITHTWTGPAEPELTLRRFDFVSLEAGSGVYLYDRTTPDGRRVRRLLVEQGERLVYESSGFELSLGASREGRKGYPVPSELRIGGPPVEASIELATTLVKHDPLGDLPQPFRLLLSFAMRPRRVWTDSPFQLQLAAGPDRPALEIGGPGITSLTYLNPLPSPASF